MIIYGIIYLVIRRYMTLICHIAIYFRVFRNVSKILLYPSPKILYLVKIQCSGEGRERN